MVTKCGFLAGGWRRNTDLHSEKQTLIPDNKKKQLITLWPFSSTQIYVCGGFNGQECLQTCEYYCPKTNQWTMITPMSTLRSGIGVIAYAERVFAVST